MKNIDVIKAFLNDERGKTKNLWTDGASLVNYNTTIGHWFNDTVFVNKHRYSTTTSKLQNQLIREAELAGVKVVVTDVVGNIDLVYFAINYSE